MDERATGLTFPIRMVKHFDTRHAIERLRDNSIALGDETCPSEIEPMPESV